ncbi:MAG: hypothetical protein PHF84_00695, partial [bacterium]|nr:hypothetical protein [bacterium]
MKILFVSPLNRRYHLYNYAVYDSLKNGLKHSVPVFNFRMKLIPDIDRCVFRRFSILGYLNTILVYFLFFLYSLVLRPEMIFVIKGDLFRPFWLRFIRQFLPAVRFINWFMDMPHLKSLAFRIGPAYDLFLVNDSSGLDELRQKGIRAEFIPFCFSSLFGASGIKRPKDKRAGQSGLVFVGTYSPLREKVLSCLTSFPLEIHGPGWLDSGLRAWVRSNGVYGEEMFRLFQRAKVVLNINQNFLVRRNPASCMNIRIVEV